jgi:GT2 family glycosyltransferase
MIRLLVSIVNYNSYDDTYKLIKFINDKLDTRGFELCFFVVDNGDKKDQPAFLNKTNKIANFILANKNSSLDSKFNYLFDTSNQGFGAANNIVINHVNNTNKFDIVWMLNSDLEPDVNCLSSIKKYILESEYNILGSVIFEKEHVIYGTVGMATFRGYGHPSAKEFKKDIIEVDAVSGASMFFKASILKELKFDENFFMYVEENDLCYRFGRQGVKSYVVTDSIVHHEGGKTFGNEQALRWYYKVRNLLYFKRKNGAINVLLIPYLFISTLKNFKLDVRYFRAYFLGLFDYLVGKMGRTKRKF